MVRGQADRSAAAATWANVRKPVPRLVEGRRRRFSMNPIGMGGMFGANPVSCVLGGIGRPPEPLPTERSNRRPDLTGRPHRMHAPPAKAEMLCGIPKGLAAKLLPVDQHQKQQIQGVQPQTAGPGNKSSLAQLVLGRRDQPA